MREAVQRSSFWRLGGSNVMDRSQRQRLSGRFKGTGGLLKQSRSLLCSYYLDNVEKKRLLTSTWPRWTERGTLSRRREYHDQRRVHCCTISGAADHWLQVGKFSERGGDHYCISVTLFSKMPALKPPQPDKVQAAEQSGIQALSSARFSLLTWRMRGQ